MNFSTHPPETKREEDFKLVYADAALLVVEKPARLLSVPGRGPDKQDALIRRVQARYPDALIVHRLDFDTSGLLVIARGKKIHRALSILFQERQTEKRYVAVVSGRLAPESGAIDLPIAVDWPNRPLHRVDFDAGKPSLTRYRAVEYDAENDASRVELTPVTGRTHQLRVHMQAIGHAILGDPLYADDAVRAKAERLLLHAATLAFAHPESGEFMQFESTAGF
ncbi:MAG: RluA family pseudouridine synthase [Candidatus Accumulibacter sp.]|nr:RluA family pseudouridine synthase [Accumulibacter sp.]